MILALLQQLDRIARLLVPFVLGVVLVLLSALPLYVPGYGQVAADVGLMVVFYWAIYRPDLMPVVAVFLLGLWQDILSGAPIGLHALILPLVHWAIVSQRVFFQGKSFAVIWWCFSMVALAAAFVSWALVCLVNVMLIDPVPVVFQALLTISVYPFLTWLLARAQHAVVRPA